VKLKSIHLISESKAQVWDFIYKGFQTDKTPRALILGAFVSNRTGNTLVSAINTRLLNTGEAKKLYSILDRVSMGNDLQERVKILRELAGDIFNKAYRTYDSEKMVSVVKNYVDYDEESYQKAKQELLDDQEKEKDDQRRYQSDDQPVQTPDETGTGELDQEVEKDTDLEYGGSSDAMVDGEYRSDIEGDQEYNRGEFGSDGSTSDNEGGLPETEEDEESDISQYP
jgi:hypothetical protein